MYVGTPGIAYQWSLGAVHVLVCQVTSQFRHSIEPKLLCRLGYMSIPVHSSKERAMIRGYIQVPCKGYNSRERAYKECKVKSIPFIMCYSPYNSYILEVK